MCACVWGLIEMEDAFHQLPLLCRGHASLYQLELCHVVLPFGLTWKGAKACHGGVPVKVHGGLHYHEQTCAQQVDFHLQDAHLANAFGDFLPDVFLAMTATILGYEFGIVAKVQRLAIALDRTVVFLYGITVLGIFHRGKRFFGVI